MIYKTLLIFILCFFLAANSLQDLQLVFVHSYNNDSYYTTEQNDGLLDAIKSIHNYDIKIKEFYMKTDSEHINSVDRSYVADIIVSKIDKIHPNYVFTTDDQAFKYVGIRLANLGYKVFASGLNESFDTYKKEFPDMNTNNIVEYSETIKLNLLFSFFDASYFTPKKWYILYDDDFVSYNIRKNYEQELQGKGEVIFKKISTVAELREFIIKTQTDYPSVYCIALQVLKDTDKRQYVSSKQFIKEFLFFNVHNLELGSSPELAKYGLSLACGPNLYEMGESLVSSFLKSALSGQFKAQENFGINTLYINAARLAQLNQLYLAANGIKYVKKVFDSYETK